MLLSKVINIINVILVTRRNEVFYFMKNKETNSLWRKPKGIRERILIKYFLII